MAMRQSIDEANNGAIALGTHSLIRPATTTPVPIPGAIRRSLSISARGSSYNTQVTATPGSFTTVTEQQSNKDQYAEDNTSKQLGFGSNNDNAGSTGNGAAVSTTRPSMAQSLGSNSAIDPLSQVSQSVIDNCQIRVWKLNHSLLCFSSKSLCDDTLATNCPPRNHPNICELSRDPSPQA